MARFHDGPETIAKPTQYRAWSAVTKRPTPPSRAVHGFRSNRVDRMTVGHLDLDTPVGSVFDRIRGMVGEGFVVTRRHDLDSAPVDALGHGARETAMVARSKESSIPASVSCPASPREACPCTSMTMGRPRTWRASRWIRSRPPVIGEALGVVSELQIDHQGMFAGVPGRVNLFLVTRFALVERTAGTVGVVPVDDLAKLRVGGVEIDRIAERRSGVPDEFGPSIEGDRQIQAAVAVTLGAGLGSERAMLSAKRITKNP